MLTKLERAIFSPLGEEPPTEFRIFAAGEIQTSKGTFFFGPAECAAVLAAYRQSGVDYIVDLEHLSSDRDARLLRADATDARAHFALEERDGELWAVNVRWTPDGERRLREKTQRYTSPTFKHDNEGRILELCNVALTSEPATFYAKPLVAANRHTASLNQERKMDPAKLKAALEAVKNGDAASALTLLEEMIVSAASGEAPAPAESDALAETPDEAPAKPEEKPAEASAALSKHNAELKSTVKFLSARVDALEAERAELDAIERRKLVGSLVKLSAELPATAWEGDPEKGQPVKRLRDEPLADLRARVSALSAARGAVSEREDEAPAPAAYDVKALSKAELAACKRAGMTPEEFAERKASAAKRVR